jgi:hypothetical protein
MEDRITSLPEVDLVAMGAPFRAPYLLQQANHTIELARAEGEPLAKCMAPGLLDKVVKERDNLATKFEDKSVSAAEAKLATGTQNSAVRSVTVWGRGATARACAAIRAGALLPDELTQPLNAKAVPAAVAQAQRKLALLTEHAPAMDKVGAPTQPLIDEGRRLCDALIAADSAQELSRWSSLPAVVRSFYITKAQLYTGLKMINDAGHELYAHDPQSSSRFNLSLLYRRPGARTTEPSPTPPTPPTPPVAAP